MDTEEEDQTDHEMQEQHCPRVVNGTNQRCQKLCQNLRRQCSENLLGEEAYSDEGSGNDDGCRNQLKGFGYEVRYPLRHADRQILFLTEAIQLRSSHTDQHGTEQTLCTEVGDADTALYVFSSHKQESKGGQSDTARNIQLVVIPQIVCNTHRYIYTHHTDG